LGTARATLNKKNLVLKVNYIREAALTNKRWRHIFECVAALVFRNEAETENKVINIKI